MPATVPTMASTPASVMNITCRLAERGVGDGGGGGPTRSRPPVIDLANNRLRSNFILPRGYPRHCSKFPARTGLLLRHGYRRGAGLALGRLCRRIVAGTPGAGSVLG